MLWDASAIRGYSIDASDGLLGAVSDFLFSDDSWRIRWVVVDTGNWLSGRKALLHPSALGQTDPTLRRFPVKLTKQQVKDSPDVATDQPVSRQMEAHLYDYYGWDPDWTITHSGTYAPLVPQPYHARAELRDPGTVGPLWRHGDPNLRSVDAVTGYHVHATDGAIGHVEDLLLDDVSWDIRYILVDTKNWWPGERVLISPCLVQGIEWTGKFMTLDVARQKVKDSPRYDPNKTVDRAYESQLQTYYGWPGYGL